MKILLYDAFALSGVDIGVGPSKFARFDSEGEPIAVDQNNTQSVSRGPSFAIRTLGVFADINVQKINIQPMKINYSQILDDDDQQKKEEQASCPTGGCPPESKKLNRDIYDTELAKVVKENNLDTSDPVQKRKAHMRVARQMQRQVKENRAHEEQDREGPPSATGPNFVLKDGGMYYPKFDKSLQKMYESQKEIREWEYDAKEHATLSLIEEAFRTGASTAVHIGHHIDNKNGESIRDIIILRYDAETNTGTMEIRNIAIDGKYHSYEEAIRIMAQEFSGMNEIHPEHGIGIVTDAKISDHKVDTILASHDVSQLYSRTSDWVFTDTADTFGYVATTMYRDIGDAYVSLKNYMKKKDENDIVVPPSLKKLLDVSDEKENMEQEISNLMDTLLTLDIRNEKILEGNAQVLEWRRIVEKALNISPKQSEQLLRHVEETHAIIQDAQEVMAYTADTGVAIAAGIFALHEIVGSKNEDINSKYTEEGELLLFQETPFIISREASKLVLSLFSFKEKQDSSEALFTNAQLEVAGIDTNALYLIIDLVHAIDTMAQEKQLERITQEKDKALQNINFLLDVMVRRMKNHMALDSRSAHVSGGMHEIKRVEDTPVEQFSFVVAFWFMLKYANYFSALDSLQEFITRPHEKKNIIDAILEEKPKGLIQKEPSPSLLSAIIWYLAMIREQGIYTTTATPPVQKKKTKNVQIPAFTGVIFAYGS